MATFFLHTNLTREVQNQMRKYLLFLFLSITLVFLMGGILSQGGPRSTGRLISIEPLPEVQGEMCEMQAVAPATLIAALQQETRPGQAQRVSPRGGEDVSERPPVRVIHDDYPAFSAVSVDPIRNEVAVTDENMFSIMVYDRLENTTSKTAA